MWQPSGQQYVWRDGEFSLTVDLTRPASGLLRIERDGQPFDSIRPLQLSARGEPTGEASRLRDAYVRGDDLVASYVEPDSEQFLPQIYWRVLPPRPESRLAGVELLVSVQTLLLDSTATVISATDVGSGDVRRYELTGEGEWRHARRLEHGRQQRSNTPAVTLFRPEGAEWSYGEMICPADFHEMRWAASAESPEWDRLEAWLFAEPLEKGVIRRGRLRAVWLPRDDDETRLRAEFSEFLHSPLPLTT